MLLESRFDYEWYTDSKHLPNCKRAREKSREKWADTDDEDLVVIKVDGFHCIAKVVNFYTPIEISEMVFPFDKDRIYPMQEIERKIYFKY